jgi:tRNA 2-thiocytidine biosynthesis protein TtcA
LVLEKTLLHKVGEAIGRFNMIREGDRVAVGLSGGKDSVTLLNALLLLEKRSPIKFSVCAFTIEQGKFSAPDSAARRMAPGAGNRLDVLSRYR